MTIGQKHTLVEKKQRAKSQEYDVHSFKYVTLKDSAHSTESNVSINNKDILSLNGCDSATTRN